MISRKKKECKDCGKETYIYARELCQFCYQKDCAIRYQRKKKQMSKVRLKPISDKRAKELRIYRKERDKYMKEHPICEARLSGCTLKATDLHHISGRSTFDYLTNPKYFLAVCRACHTKIDSELSLKENIQRGFKLIRSV